VKKLTRWRAFQKRICELFRIDQCCIRWLRIISRNGFLPRPLWKLIRPSGTFAVKASEAREFRYETTFEDNIGRQLYWRDLEEFEPEVLPSFRILVEEVECKVFLDVGANTGVYTLLAATLNDAIRCHAFEPLPEVYDHLRKNVELNPAFLGRCQVHRMGLGNMSGNLGFCYLADLVLPMGASALPGNYDEEDPDFRRVICSVEPGDEICGRLKLAPDLIKIDTEGLEVAVVEGFGRVIEEYSPSLIFEVSNLDAANTLAVFLEKGSYQSFWCSREGLKRVTQLADCLCNGFAYFVAIHSSRSSSINRLKGLMVKG
jgi:FkbM family methyltransferase